MNKDSICFLSTFTEAAKRSEKLPVVQSICYVNYVDCPVSMHVSQPIEILTFVEEQEEVLTFEQSGMEHDDPPALGFCLSENCGERSQIPDERVHQSLLGEW